MKTLVLGVWHPFVEKYGDDYFTSLQEQTDRDFDLLIITDKTRLPDRFRGSRIKILEAVQNSTPADIRFQGICFARENHYQNLIFSDCDDYFSCSRIEKSKAGLNEADFFVNNLTAVSENKTETEKSIYKLNDSFPLPEKFSFADLLKSNYFGMSNTALRISAVPEKFYIPSELVAVDWWIFSILLLYGKQFIFDEGLSTYYRQHSDNIAGMGHYLSREKLVSGIRVKLQHYGQLAKFCRMMGFEKQENQVRNEFSKVSELLERTRDDCFVNEYLSVINRNYAKIRNGWWSEILPLNEWSKYV